MTRPTVVADDVRSDAERADLPLDVDRYAELARACLATEGAAGELTLAFVDLDEMARLNVEHMGKEGPTDVLSFPIDDADEVPDDVPVLLGDVVVSPRVAHRQFGEHAGTFDDEIALLVVHGVLHVLGHDHAAPDESATMREREMALLEAHHWGGRAPVGFRQTHE